MEGWCETHAATQDPGPSLSQNLSQNPKGGTFVSLEASGSSRSLEVPGMYRLEREKRHFSDISSTKFQGEKCGQEEACDYKKPITEKKETGGKYLLLVLDKPSIVATILKDRAPPLKHEESSGLCAPLPAGRPRQPGCCMHRRGLAGGCESLAVCLTTHHGQSPRPAGDRAGSPRGACTLPLCMGLQHLQQTGRFCCCPLFKPGRGRVSGSDI